MTTRTTRFGSFVIAAVLLIAGLAVITQAAQRKPAYPKAYPDLGITLLDDGVADLDAADGGALLAYSRRDPRDLFFDLWTIRLSGSPDRRCLSCALPTTVKHSATGSWHPSAQYLAFSAENDDVRTRKGDRLAEPGVGLNTNLWVMTADGSRSWKLTDFETDYEQPKGAVRPRFSPDGRRLVWSGPVDMKKTGPGFEWGEWALSIADFDVQGGTPVLRGVRTLQPGAQHAYYEAADWSPDGKHLLIVANPRAGQAVTGKDIYEFDLETNVVRALTRTDREWDDMPRYAPDGRHVLWASSRGLDVRFRSLDAFSWRREVKTELWMMNRDGTGARRLTFFNETGWRDQTWFQSAVGQAARVSVIDGQYALGRTHAAVVLAYESRAGQAGSVLALVDIERRRTLSPPPSSPPARHLP
jgi:hypothetical protein